jgi:hypothetical protein
MWVYSKDLMIDSICSLMFIGYVCSKLNVLLSILNVVLFVDVMNKTFIFVKFDDRSLLYNYNNPWNS